MTEPPALEFCVDAGPHSLERARLQMLAFLGRWQAVIAHARTVYALELVLEEWLTNVFRHGSAVQARVKVSVQADHVELRFDDDGAPFDPTHRPPAALPASLDEARPGGLGLYLIQQYARSWHYARESGRNVMHIRVNRPPD